MRITCAFVSNYLNHHQIPFCNAMDRFLRHHFLFIQTEPMEEERIRMGWNNKLDLPYLKLYYEQPEESMEIIREADLVLFGGCEEEGYIRERLNEGKPVIRYSERLYKTGQWKAISPRGLKKKYEDHTRYRRASVYLLCAGGYVASDFHIIHAYSSKMYRWGYFPETRYYDIEKLMEHKGMSVATDSPNACDRMDEKSTLPYILWTARMIDCKHPELALETARYLKEKGYQFRMELIGGGVLSEKMESLRREYGLEDCVNLLGFLNPDQVRDRMEKADIFLFTSDRQEGWGAVANEAMNSGCALVANHMIGAVPYLIRDGVNGRIYRDGNKEELFTIAEQLVRNRALCRELGRNAYVTITECWNAENAAYQLLCLAKELKVLTEKDMDLPELSPVNQFVEGPCTPAPMISEKKMYRRMTGR